MKRIISSSLLALIILSFWCILFFTLLIITIGFEMFGFVDEKGAGYLAFCVFLVLFCFSLWFLNRSACVVWIEENVVKRKGLICGFYKECPIESIETVKIQHAWHEGDFIYLVDSSIHKFDRLRKDSYISFRKNKNNLTFLRTFWSGEIEK
jgi:hypothetical protein